MKIGFLICGPSGTGKSSHISKMLNNAGITEELDLIDPDKINEDSHKKQSEKAFQTVLNSIDSGKSFIYIATCGGTSIILDILSKMKKKKYRTIVAIPYTTLGTALKRIAERTDQPVSEDVVRDLHSFFAKKAERFMNMKNLDEVYLYNNETDFNLLLKMKNKKVICSKNSEFYFDISKYC